MAWNAKTKFQLAIVAGAVAVGLLAALVPDDLVQRISQLITADTLQAALKVILFTIGLLIGADVVRRLFSGELGPFSKALFGELAEVLSSLVGVTNSYSSNSFTPPDAEELKRLLERLEKRPIRRASLSTEAEEKILMLFEDALGKGLNDEIKIALDSILTRTVRDEFKNYELTTLQKIQDRLASA